MSATSLPLPAGAAVAALQPALNGDGGSLVHITNPISSVSVSNFPASQAPVAPGAASATASSLVGCVANTTLPSFAAGQQGAVACDLSGHLYVVTVPSANNVPGYLQAVSAGGATPYRAINPASSTMAAVVKASSGMIYGYEACNGGSSVAYLRFFALGVTPVVGTSVPQVSKVLPAGACQTMTTSIGVVFTNGIAMDVTTGGLADSDTVAIATANQIAVEVYYK